MEQSKKVKEFSNATIQKTALDHTKIIQRLAKPSGMIDVVLDTDTYNEIDDQYALAYLVKSNEKLNLKAIYAAPFTNEKADTPGEGMEKSYQEIFKVLTLLGRDDLKKNVYRGAESYMQSEDQPVISDAAKDLAQRAMDYTEEDPLYVVAIAAITNISSALTINPEIKNRIVLVWLGGNAAHWPNNREYNLYQDIAGARVVFGCGVPLVQLPCMGVVSAFRISGPELETHLRNKNELCNYLIDVTLEQAKNNYDGLMWSRAIWDVTAVAWLLDGEFMEDCLMHSPIPEYDDRYAFDNTRHMIKYVYYINRDNLFEDLISKLKR
ncbi:nucleoside hydrolase [Enterocloster citroniae]|uniref:nucleoside hydrolase n=1 Tax=Enterocloster citroniae TaxID=358743 RepID=UPI001D082D64|nr:nucleoside hydrolase [Enterocloster citroniae]MCB7068064.1 nucleoside hydrolase [Enterocloster citroniae]